MIQFWAHPTLGKAWHLAFDRISTTLLSMSYLPVRVPVLHIQDWSWNRRKQLCCPEHLKFVCCSETNCWIRGIGLSDDSTGIVCFSLRIDSLRRAINFWFFLRQGLVFFGFLVLCFPVFCFFCFLLFLLFAFPASLLFMLLCFTCFFSFLLLCFPCFSAFLLLCFCAFLLLLFYWYLFFSSVMCFCCSTSCSSASLLPVFTASLFVSFMLRYSLLFIS